MRAGTAHRNNRGAERGVATLVGWRLCYPPGYLRLSQNIPEKIGLIRAGIKSLIVCVRA